MSHSPMAHRARLLTVLVLAIAIGSLACSDYMAPSSCPSGQHLVDGSCVPID